MKCISAESKTAKHGQKNISSIPKACTLRTVQGCAYADMETVRFPCCQQTLKQKKGIAASYGDNRALCKVSSKLNCRTREKQQAWKEICHR